MGRGFPIFSPVDRVAYVESPTSIPTEPCGVINFFLGGWFPLSTTIQMKNLPVFVETTIHCLGLPLNLRWRTVFTFPILGRYTLWVSNSTSFGDPIDPAKYNPPSQWHNVALDVGEMETIAVWVDATGWTDVYVKVLGEYGNAFTYYQRI